MEREERCMNSSMLTEGGNTTGVFYPGGEYEQEVAAVGKLTEAVSTPPVPSTLEEIFSGKTLPKPFLISRHRRHEAARAAGVYDVS